MFFIRKCFFKALPYFIFLINSISLNAQIESTDFNNFQHYTAKDGLPSPYIVDIVEDKNGFIWLATGKGISRFDGNFFSNYSYYRSDSLIRELGYTNSVQIINKTNEIWLSNSRGVFYSSLDSIKFHSITDIIPNLSFEWKDLTKFFIDENKIIWTGTVKNGLIKIDIKNKTFKQFSFVNPDKENSYLINNIIQITPDNLEANILWISTIGGLVRFNKVKNKYQVFVFGNNSKLHENRIRKILVTDDDVYLGTWSKGLIVFNKNKKQFSKPFKSMFPNSNKLILDLYKKKSSIWITTDDGIILFNTEHYLVEKKINNETKKGLLKGISYIDSRGIVWFASTKGLFKYQIKNNDIKYIELEKRNNVQATMEVRKIIKSNQYIYVLGNYSSGLYKIDSKNLSFTTLKMPFLNHSVKDDYLLADMVKMDNGNLLILSVNKIFIFNPRLEKFTISPLQIDNPFPVYRVVEKDRFKNYWIGTRTSGLYKLNFENNKITNFKKEFDQVIKGNHEWIEHLFVDSKDKLWIRNARFMSVMNLKNESIKMLLPHKEGFIFRNVGGFLEDNKNRLWISGHEEGLGYIDQNKPNNINIKSDIFTQNIFKLNDSIFLTIGEKAGLFNSKTFEYKQFEESFLNKRVRISGPVLKIGKMKYIIGSNNGVLLVNLEKINTNNEIPLPYIREITSNGNVVYAGNSLKNQFFNFKSNTQNLIFKVSSLGFQNNNDIAFQYKILDSWHDIGKSNEVNLTNLSYGNFILELRALNKNKVYSNNHLVYNINILRPWWVTWWAFLLYFLIISFITVYFYRFHTAKKIAISESKRLKEISKLKNSLYTNITHEFRTPLTVILGMADMLKLNINKKEFNTEHQPLEMIERNGKKLLRLVNEMLDLSKLESGKMKLNLIQSDVILFIKYITESFRSLAFEKNLDLILYTETDSIIMDFDVNKLTVIISNLLSNAIKYSNTNDKIIFHVSKSKIENHPFLNLNVKDYGKGISKENIKNIFDKFYRIEGESSKNSSGTGIGLALTKETIELMGGSIQVKSKLGSGTKFNVVIPISNEAKKTTNVETYFEPDFVLTNKLNFNEENKEAQSDLPLVLIIEDNSDIVYYLESCLNGIYKVISANNGKLGIEMAYEKIPEAVITDVMMPEKNGYEVCNKLKSDERTDHIPIILLTAKTSDKDKLKGLSCGADAYLTKPFVKAELLTRLEQLVLLRRKLLQRIDENSINEILKVKAIDPETKFLQKIVHIIHKEISNHSFGSSKQLAYKMNLSESQIYRKIKVITGKSTAVFIRSVRLQKAKELILNSNLTISQIAYEVGFNDPSWFSRAFKEEFGYSPSAIHNQ